VIRRATPSDATAIAAIWNPYIRDTAVTFNSAEKSAADVATLIRDRDAAGFATFVAETGAGPAGFASYSQFRGGVGYARSMEHTILLSPAARGGGLGRALLQAVEDHARAGGAHGLFAGVSAENPEGRAFHARMGFAEVAVLREAGFKFGRYMDLVLMQKFL
jgi:phosphinothricin acetyltransferase